MQITFYTNDTRSTVSNPRQLYRIKIIQQSFHDMQRLFHNTNLE